MKKLIYILLVGVLMIACHKTAPQRPSQHNGKTPPKAVDTLLLQLLNTNEHLADEADRIVTQTATRQEGNWHQMECGAWTNYIEADEPIEIGTTCVQVRFCVRLLDSTLIVENEGKYTLHKAELPLAVEQLVVQMQNGDSASIIAPWYTAYGAQGNEHVKAYENVLINVYKYEL